MAIQSVRSPACIYVARCFHIALLNTLTDSRRGHNRSEINDPTQRDDKQGLPRRSCKCGHKHIPEGVVVYGNPARVKITREEYEGKKKQNCTAFQ